MTHCLRLPRLHDSVPRVIVPPTLRGDNARLARYLVDAGALRAKDIPDQWRDPLAVCRVALNRWIRRELPPLHCLTPRLWLEPISDSVACSSPSTGASGGLAPTRYTGVRVAWCSETVQCPVGLGLQGLERLASGLGATALDILTARTSWIVPLFAPDVAQYWASWLYWYGEDDETLALEENCGDDTQAQAAMRADMVTREKVLAAFPSWALNPARHRIKSAALKRLDTREWPGSAVELITDLLLLDRLRVRDDYRPDIDGEFIGFAAVLSWHEDDLSVRIFDDGVNLATQAEYCDIAGECMASVQEPEVLRAWIKGMPRRMKVMAVADRLIWRLMHPDWLDATAENHPEVNHASRQI